MFIISLEYVFAIFIVGFSILYFLKKDDDDEE
jgi:hypothetical protein